MEHELLGRVLDAQRINATLSGDDLRTAARDLAKIAKSSRAIFTAFDAVGERIIGAAIALGDDAIELFDYTRAFPKKATCVLVGGAIAGPVGVADKAAAMRAAGARRVEAAMLSSWSQAIPDVSSCHVLGARSRASVRVA